MITTEDLKIDVNTLANWLAKKKLVTILDVRPKTEREEWLIPGSIHADVYVKLKADDRHALDDLNLDKSRPVVTVFAAGKTRVRRKRINKSQEF